MKAETTIDKDGIEEILISHEDRMEDLEKKVAEIGKKKPGAVPITIPATVVEETAKAISEKVAAGISVARCAPPDPETLKAEFSQAILPVIESRIRSIDLNVRTSHVVELEDDTKQRLRELGNSVDQIRRNFNVKPLSQRQLFWNRASIWIIGALALSLTVFGLIYYNSATYWGMRHYKVCNHPLQDKAALLDSKDSAYEFTIDLWKNDKSRKARFKQIIRTEEQRLKGRQMDM